ncbi:MFS transporter [Kineococcus arenarius]|uniref:MFS transporter n=1 Tax=Kineococcus sp. SYSU DK007 TaxID=3383128 RepID=UPI003D7C8A6D
MTIPGTPPTDAHPLQPPAAGPGRALPAPAGRPGPGPAYLIGLAAASTAMMASLLSVGILTMPLKAAAIDAAGATTTLSIANGFAGALSLLAYPVFGRLSDRTTWRTGRRRPYLLLGAALIAAGAVLLLRAGSTAALAAGWTVMTLGQTSAMAALGASIPDQLPAERRGLASAVFGVAGTVGAVVGLGLGSAFSPSMTAMVLVPAGLAVVMLVVFALVLEDRRLDRSARPALAWSEVFGTFWVNPVRHTGFSLAFASRFAVFCSIAAVNAYQVIYMIRSLHVAPAEVATKAFLATLVSGLTSLAFALAMGKLSDKVGRRKPFVVVSAVVFGVGIAMVAAASSFEEFLVAVTVVGIGQGVYLAVDFALVTHVLPDPENPAKDLGIMNLASSLPNIVVPVLAPALLAIGASQAGQDNFSALFLAGAVTGVLGAILVVPIRRVR